MKNFFKPEDFQIPNVSGDMKREIEELSAAIANEKLNGLPTSWPIEREPCKHEPLFLVGSAPIATTCKHCGVELRAKWSEVKK